MIRLFCVFLFALFSILPSFASYNPIPIDRQKEYKIEIERIIKNEVPELKKEVDCVVEDAKKLHDNLIKNGYNQSDYDNLLLSSEVAVWGFDSVLDTKLIKYTQKEYFNYSYNPNTLDDFYKYKEYLYKNIKLADIDTSKINELINYEKAGNKKIQKYIKNVQKQFNF